MALGVSALVSSVGYADIKGPSEVNCTVTKVVPTGARFFGFSKPIVVGDKTALDLNTQEIDKIKFDSGAYIGSTVTKHALVKQKSYEGMSFFEVSFISNINHQNYNAVLVAHEVDEKGNIQVGVDVLQKANLGRLTLNQLDMQCVRK